MGSARLVSTAVAASLPALRRNAGQCDDLGAAREKPFVSEYDARLCKREGDYGGSIVAHNIRMCICLR